MKRTISQLEEARDFGQAVVETISEPVAVLTSDFRARNANDAFASLFHLTRQTIHDRSLFETMRDHDGIREVRKQLDGVIPTGAGLTDYKVRVDLPGVGPTTLLVSGRRIVTGTRSYPLILLSLRVV